ncbi:hypothetical protein SDC9_105353 [bioreactor metagenome]|uniref:Uncharacterized protein n=1 Tax=bioreactor metagenome TaxID=1076179 RepID=A0A645AZB1_9ZZZZ
MLDGKRGTGHHQRPAGLAHIDHHAGDVILCAEPVETMGPADNRLGQVMAGDIRVGLYLGLGKAPNTLKAPA